MADAEDLREKIKFVERWADYVTSHDDWSAQQKVLIDTQLENARQVGLTREQVDAIRKAGKAVPP
jgi:hypothetical protein